MRRIAAIAFGIVACLGLSSSRAADPKPLEIGAQAPDFDLPGVDGKNHKLSDYASAKVLVVLWTCNHCPTAQAYEDRIEAFHQKYKDKGVALVAISPNDPKAVRLDELGYTDLTDSFDDMKIRARDKKYSYPYLYDGDTQKVAHAYGVLATPHVYVFDADRKLRYNGRFDDSEVKTVKSHDAINAVEAVLAGKPAPVEKTRVVGCSTKWAEKQADAVKSVAKWDAEPVSLNMIDDAGVAKLAKNGTKNYRLINVWATWCGPCVAELDELVTIKRMYTTRPFEVVTISMDEPSKKDQALKLLTEKHASTKNYLIETADRDKFAEALDKDWPGPVPYTILVSPEGKVVYRKTGAFDALELKRAIVDQIGRTYK